MSSRKWERKKKQNDGVRKVQVVVIANVKSWTVPYTNIFFTTKGVIERGINLNTLSTRNKVTSLQL